MNLKIVYIVSIFDQTQKCLFEALYKHYKSSFVLIIVNSRRNSEVDSTRTCYFTPYTINYYENKKQCKEIIKNSNVIFISGVHFSFIRKFIRNRLIIKVGERFYKKPVQSFFDKIKNKIGILVHYKFFLRWNTIYFGIGQHVKEDLEKAHIFKNKAYDFAYYSNYVDFLDEPKQYMNFPIRICWVGRLVDWKHPEKVLELAEFVRNKRLPITFEIFGNDCPKFYELAESIKNKKIENIVSIKNEILGEKVFATLRSFDFSLTTSGIEEGWGLTIQNSMSQGTPAISFYLSGAAKFLIREKTGFIYKNEKELKNVLIKLSKMTNTEYCNMSLLAIKFLEKNLNPDKFSERLEKLYYSIMNKKEYNVFKEGILKNIY